MGSWLLLRRGRRLGGGLHFRSDAKLVGNFLFIEVNPGYRLLLRIQVGSLLLRRETSQGCDLLLRIGTLPGCGLLLR